MRAAPVISTCFVMVLLGATAVLFGSADASAQSKAQQESQKSVAALRAMKAEGYWSLDFIDVKLYCLKRCDADIRNYRPPLAPEAVLADPRRGMWFVVRSFTQGSLWANPFFSLVSQQEQTLGALGDIFLCRGEYELAEHYYLRRIASQEAMDTIICTGQQHPTIRAVNNIDDVLGCYSRIKKLKTDEHDGWNLLVHEAADTLILLAATEDLKGNIGQADRLYNAAFLDWHLEENRLCLAQFPEFEYVLKQVAAKTESEFIRKTLRSAMRMEVMAEFYSCNNQAVQARSCIREAIAVREKEKGSANSIMLDYDRSKLGKLRRALNGRATLPPTE